MSYIIYMYNIFQEFDVSLINDELLGFSVTCKLPSDHPFAPAATITLANHECWWDKFYIPCRELPYQWNRKVYLPNCLRRYYLGLSGNHPSFLLSSGFLWISFFRKFVQCFNCSVSARCQGHQGCWIHVGFRCNEVILRNPLELKLSGLPPVALRAKAWEKLPWPVLLKLASFQFLLFLVSHSKKPN